MHIRNKLESEDDFGQADIVLSVVTGKIVGYSIIIVIAKFNTKFGQVKIILKLF